MDGTLSFGAFRLNAARRELTAGGEAVAIGPRAMDVLLALLRRPGELITKDDLQREVWGGAVVEDNAIAAQVAAVRRALGDAGGRFVQTAPGRGYRFVGEVRAEGPAAPAAGAGPYRSGRERRVRLAIGALAGVAFVAGYWFLIIGRFGPAPAPWSERDPRHSFAISEAPVAGDPALAAYADGFTRALRDRFHPGLGEARLARDPADAGYAASLEFRRAGAGVVAHIVLRQRPDGRLLGVRDIGEAAVGAPSAAAVWHASAFVKTTALRVDAAAARAKAPAARDARDLALMALAEPEDHAHNAEAVALYEAAARRAPAQSLAAEGLVNLIDARLVHGWSADPAGDLARVRALDARLLRDDPEDTFALYTLADSYWLEGRWEDALTSAERMLAVMPDNLPALLASARADLALGRYAEADAILARVEPYRAWNTSLAISQLSGLTRFHEGRYEEAAEHLRRAVQLAPPEDLARPAYAGLRLYLAAAEAKAGHAAEAKAALADFRAAVPAAARPADFWRWNDAVRFPPVDRDRVDAALKELGWG